MIIAKRKLNYMLEDGTNVAVPVCLFSPVYNGQDWGCQYTIEWPNGVEAYTIFGLDQMQVIVLALQGVGASLYLSDYHKTGRLYFNKLGNGYGFPVPKNIRDMLVGGDKEFDG